MAENTPSSPPKGRLKEIAALFFKLGCIAFGGPAAHISMMQQEVVEKRKWLTNEAFLDTVGATNLIPGPNSTEMTMHCGYARGGWKGLFLAGICFIFPAVLTTTLLAYFYVNYGQLPEVEPFFRGIKPAVIVVILAAVYKLGKKALKTKVLVAVGILVLALSFLGFSEIYTLLIAGAIGWLIYWGKDKLSLLAFLPALIAPPRPEPAIPLVGIFWSFLKMGSILYGSGYVLMGYLEGEFVDRLGWLTTAELMDAIAIGQFTPGPVLSTASFVGFQLGSWSGALLASVGIFLPSFLFVLILSPFLPRLQKNPTVRAILDAVNVGALVIMLVVCFKMGKEVLFDWKQWSVLALAAAAHFGLKWNAMYIVLLGAVMGFLLSLV